jgi:hypothetical protein
MRVCVSETQQDATSEDGTKISCVSQVVKCEYEEMFTRFHTETLFRGTQLIRRLEGQFSPLFLLLRYLRMHKEYGTSYSLYLHGDNSQWGSGTALGTSLSLALNTFLVLQLIRSKHKIK